MRRAKPYLQLVRLPNLFTAAADPLAGWLLVGGSAGDVAGWWPLVASGVAAYAAGMILNDVFDYETDHAERPGRPLPSGRVPRRVAAFLGTVLLIGCPTLAFAHSIQAATVALALAGCVLAYDAGLKHTVLGPEIMGACRSLNLLLGMSGDPRLGGPAGWVAAAAFGLFVCGITWISRDEARPVGEGRSRLLLLGMAAQDVALLGLMASALQVLPFPGRDAGRPLVPPEGLLVLLGVAWVVNIKDARAYREPAPERLQAAVKAGVLGLVWLDVGLVASVRGPGPALGVAVLWVPAFLLAKWLYAT
jgi:4-hydroxybenzoate polyprenyltransferase